MIFCLLINQIFFYYITIVMNNSYQNRIITTA